MISYDFQFIWLLIFVLGVVLLILNYFFFIVTKISKVFESRWSLLKFRSHGQRSRTILWSLSHVFSNNMYSLHLSYSTRFNVGYPESADVCQIENAKFLCIMYFMCRVICVSSLVCFKLTWKLTPNPNPAAAIYAIFFSQSLVNIHTCKLNEI